MKPSISTILTALWALRQQRNDAAERASKPEAKIAQHLFDLALSKLDEAINELEGMMSEFSESYPIQHPTNEDE